MKKQITIIALLSIATLFYAASSIAAPPFRLVGKFILAKEHFYVEGDTLKRVRVFNVKVLTKSDSVFNKRGEFLQYTHHNDTLQVQVVTKVGLARYGLSNASYYEVARHKQARYLVTPGEYGKSSIDNSLPWHNVQGSVDVLFINRKNEVVYEKSLSPTAYRVVFEGYNKPITKPVIND